MAAFGRAQAVSRRWFMPDQGAHAFEWSNEAGSAKKAAAAAQPQLVLRTVPLPAPGTTSTFADGPNLRAVSREKLTGVIGSVLPVMIRAGRPSHLGMRAGSLGRSDH